MKAGISTGPCGVWKVDLRARDFASTECKRKENGCSLMITALFTSQPSPRNQEQHAQDQVDCRGAQKHRGQPLLKVQCDCRDAEAELLQHPGNDYRPKPDGILRDD